MNCTLGATCCLLGIDYSQGVAFLGHDEGDLGFTYQEMVDLCLEHGYALLEIPAEYDVLVGKERFLHPHGTESRMRDYMRRFNGLLMGQYSLDRPHCLCWNKSFVYDPKTMTFEPLNPEFAIETFCPLIKVQ